MAFFIHLPVAMVVITITNTKARNIIKRAIRARNINTKFEELIMPRINAPAMRIRDSNAWVMV